MLRNICIFWDVTIDMKQHHTPEDLNIQQRHTFACFTTKIKKISWIAQEMYSVFNGFTLDLSDFCVLQLLLVLFSSDYN